MADDLETVPVGPFRVADAASDDVVTRVVELSTAAPERPVLVFALHVGGLNERADAAFVEAMAHADVVYADGGSVVLLARIAGASAVTRAPTTDMGWQLIAALAQALDRRVRLALVGGPDGLAERAGAELAAGSPADIVGTWHGYQDDWAATLAQVRAARPDMTVVGLGAPREMTWAVEWRDLLPPGVLLTCGGWFGHIVGDEKRAPRVIRRPGLEWLARVAQQPRRLGPRYARGVLTSAALVPSAVRARTRSRGTGSGS